MSTFNANQHPRGGNPNNKGQFSHKTYAEANYGIDDGFDLGPNHGGLTRDGRREVASDPTSDPQLLDSLATFRDWQTGLALAKNPASRPLTLHKVLIGSKRHRGDHALKIRMAIAGREDADVETLRYAAQIEPSTREVVYANPGIGVQAADSAFDRLKHHPFDRLALASNKILSERTQYKLAYPESEPDWHVRCALAANKGAVPGPLAVLVRDPNPRVREVARKNLARARLEEQEAFEQYDQDHPYVEKPFDPVAAEYTTPAFFP